MTLQAANFAAKGLLILMTSISVATGLAHSKLVIRLVQMLTRRAMFRDIYSYLNARFALLKRRHIFVEFRVKV